MSYEIHDNLSLFLSQKICIPRPSLKVFEKIGGDEAGMHAVGRHSGALEPSRELVCAHDCRQL